MLDFSFAAGVRGVDLRAVVGGRLAPDLEGIVALGDCSGVLVRSDIVLTNAHCLEGRIDSVVITGRPVRIRSCAIHPDYDPARTAHDLGFCRLEHAVDVALIPIAVGAALDAGTPVMLAGRGRSGPFTRDGGVIRLVHTSVQNASRQAEPRELSTLRPRHAGDAIAVAALGGVAVFAWFMHRRRRALTPPK